MRSPGIELTMRRLPPLSDFLAIVPERRRVLGIDEEVRARNSGRRRTAEKRELLRRINRRAREGLKGSAAGGAGEELAPGEKLWQMLGRG
jgi:hypothetical protein